MCPFLLREIPPWPFSLQFSLVLCQKFHSHLRFRIQIYSQRHQVKYRFAFLKLEKGHFRLGFVGLGENLSL